MKMNTDDCESAVPLDGNAVAGLLGEVFAREMTVAAVTCDGCGAAAPLGEVKVFGAPMGAIFRCTYCNNAVLRLVSTPRGVWLDMRGARSVLLPGS
jgi:hypothetical protein